MNVCSVGFNPTSNWNGEADAFPEAQLRSVVILSEDILDLFLPSALKSSAAKNAIAVGASQQCSGKAFAWCLYKPTVKPSSLKIPYTSGCVGSRDWLFFYGCWCHRAGEPGPQDANCCCSVMCKEDPVPSQGHHIECMCAHLSVCLHLSDISP